MFSDLEAIGMILLGKKNPYPFQVFLVVGKVTRKELCAVLSVSVVKYNVSLPFPRSICPKTPNGYLKPRLILNCICTMCFSIYITIVKFNL